MTTLHYTAATSKGQKFAVAITVTGLDTAVNVAGHADQRVALVNGKPVVKLTAAAVKALLGATLADWAGALVLDRPYAHALEQAQRTERNACFDAAQLAFQTENPELHAARMLNAHVRVIMNHE